MLDAANHELALDPSSFAVNENLEGFSFSNGQIDFVGLGVERHRPRALLGFERLHHGQLLRRILVSNGDGSVAV